MSADGEKLYEVELSATVYTTVEVEATDEAGAEEAAKKLVGFAYYGWDDEPSGVMVEGVNEVEA